MQMPTSIIGSRLKELRKSRGWKQDRVADDLCISIGTLSGYERGYRRPDAEMLRKLADYYDTSTDYILGRTDNPAPPTASETPFDYRIIFRQKDAGHAFIMAHTLKRKYDVPQEEYDRWQDEIVEFYSNLENHTASTNKPKRVIGTRKGNAKE